MRLSQSIPSPGDTIRVGCAGWSIPRQYHDEVGGTGTHLERYARTFACVEINSSFYRSHRTSTWTRWADSVPAGFRFSVKAPKTITHEAGLDCSREDLHRFLEEARGLGNKLGPLLFQLPPSSMFEQARASAFFRMLRDLCTGSVVLEPRHASWFGADANSCLQQFHISRVAADPRVVPSAFEPMGTLTYYRLHGSPRRYYSVYGENFLRVLATTLLQRAEHAEVWCIFDNTAAGAAMGDAQVLKRILNTRAFATTGV
ncbi:MAG: DUF72 domain-containing protein [Acidobacteriaceae bacterium]